MKLRNKKTGEIDDVSIVPSANKIKGVVEHEDGVQCLFAYTLKEFNEEWEDYEEPKDFWYLTGDGYIMKNNNNDKFNKDFVSDLKSINNYFETEEEAEKAVEKLKAWKRLKDLCKFSFNGTVTNSKGKVIGVKVVFDERSVTMSESKQAYKDLILLFGGEE